LLDQILPVIHSEIFNLQHFATPFGLITSHPSPLEGRGKARFYARRAEKAICLKGTPQKMRLFLNLLKEDRSHSGSRRDSIEVEDKVIFFLDAWEQRNKSAAIDGASPGKN
jgi:hypothetical protein